MANNSLTIAVSQITDRITDQMKSRGTRACNELVKAKNNVLRGQRSGRQYRKPNTRAKYTASAPGEPPAVRTGQYRRQWDEKTYATGGGSSLTVHAEIESTVRTDGGKYNLGTLLENGSPGGKIAPRPHKEKIIEAAKPKVRAIFEAPYK